ncbi:MAG: precorrin-6y C5,15-methyltransferase (decarboxylating) subunit CbiE, partial [Spirochaetota bacterium]
MNRVTVAGIGPGSAEYITPAAVKAISRSDIVIGGTRNLSALDGIPGLDTAGFARYDITGRLDLARELILSSMLTQRVTVVASGDPGFYGILGFLRKFLSADQLDVIAGISSVQYMCAKLCLPWENIRLGSLHGRDADIASLAAGGCAFLTDGKVLLSSLAEKLCACGYGNRKMYAGCSLSYPDEKIYSGL